jgi:hypothetical protein
MTTVAQREEALPEIVTRYLSGESMADIAPDFRKSRRTLYRWMLTELGGEVYREVVTQCLVARVADADQELEDARNAHDPVRVAAAREVCRFARMDLERRRPALYGPKQEVKHSGAAPSFTVVLLAQPSEGGGVVIDGSHVPALPAVVGGEASQGDDDEQEGHAGQAIGAG